MRGREGGFEDEFYNSPLVEKGDSNHVNCLTKQQQDAEILPMEEVNGMLNDGW